MLPSTRSADVASPPYDGFALMDRLFFCVSSILIACQARRICWVRVASQISFALPALQVTDQATLLVIRISELTGEHLRESLRLPPRRRPFFPLGVVISDLGHPLRARELE